MLLIASEIMIMLILSEVRCEETHIKDIFFSVVVTISWMCCTNSFIEQGFEIYVSAFKKSLIIN